MHKSFIFLNVIIITTILLFAGSLNAQRIGPLRNAAERNFHRSYRYLENSHNRNNPKAFTKAKNRFQHRNEVRENQEKGHDYANSTGPVWLKDPDFSMKTFSVPPSENDR
ncbi:MAG: hypothetical protein ACMUIU_07965 [bacterium]